jgi:acetyltransferase-like isoleucine patch superfamily enzyme
MSDLQYISKDFGGVFFKQMRKYRLRLYASYCTIISSMIMSLKGIRYGKANVFYGFPKFIRHPLSKIVLGSHITLRSDFSSNLIGVTHPCLISTGTQEAKIILGDRCGISGAVIGAINQIEIGNDAMIGANSIITDHDWHNISPSDRRKPSHTSKPVKIGNNVWIGINSIILKGVTIGDNSVIGANSVVTKSIPSNVIAAGNPCKVIKSLITESQTPILK